MSSSQPDPQALRTSMLQDDWFRRCGPALQDALLAHGRERRLQPGEHLFAQGAPDGGLYCVTGGSLYVQSADIEGELPLLVVLEPCLWFGELSFTDGLPRSHDAVAGDDTRVWCVPRQPLRAWLQGHPEGWEDIARLAVGKLRIMYSVVDEEMRRPVPQRVARRLWLALQGWGWRKEGSPLPGVRWSQDQLARMLGTSRGTVNRALRELQDSGAIRLRYGVIELADEAALRQACEVPLPKGG
ncbi:Crp/Fnr family transcriptional regulator [Aquabacterium sp.]|uniref:Crp/Fnr family transcriptional regulator n=1 Tax=Aquabacterium sp. TaxID=1872578 RepID=UPI00378371D1